MKGREGISCPSLLVLNDFLSPIGLSAWPKFYVLCCFMSDAMKGKSDVKNINNLNEGY